MSDAVIIEVVLTKTPKKNATDGGFQQRSKSEATWRLPSRSSIDLSRPFADLPRQLSEALARLQSTRSMHNLLTTSTIYATKLSRDKSTRTLQLQATSVTRSCGNVYVKADDDNGKGSIRYRYKLIECCINF